MKNASLPLLTILLLVLSISFTGIAQQVGTDDFRISFQGPNNDPSFDALESEVVYNFIDKEYFVVWSGDTIATKEEIWGQRLDSTGALLGPAVQISSMGPSGNTSYDAFDPSVTWNSTNNEYLVVWNSYNDIGSLAPTEFEVWGQLLSNTGTQIGPDDFRISFCGTDGDATSDTSEPEVAWNSVNNNYLVVWSGDSLNNDDEISGQFVDVNGTLIGNNFTISSLGNSSGDSYDAEDPAIVHNSISNEFMIAYYGDFTLVGEDEIFIARIDGATQTVTSSDIRISEMGGIGSTAYDALEPAIAWNSALNEYLVVWHSDNDTLGVVDGETEIWGQLLSNTGAEIGPDDFRISTIGTNGNTANDAFDAKVDYSTTCLEYQVTFFADETGTGGHVDGENEIWTVSISQTGFVQGNEERISSAGDLGTTTYSAGAPDIVFNADAEEFLIVWHMDDTLSPLVDNEIEIFGQRYGCGSYVCLTTFDTITTSSCGSYTAPSGAVYNSAGTYQDTIFNIAGCDSVITINLSIGTNSGATISPAACASYTTPSGLVLTASGQYTDSIPNATGCDSIITINLTIQQSSSTLNPTACSSYTAPSGVVLTTSGTYQDTIPNTAGCDSLITINLTLQQTGNSISVSQCGSYTSPAGNNYSTSGIYTDTLTNSVGCDSLLNIDLTILQNSSNTINVTECLSYTGPSGMVYTTSGTYVDTIPNTVGCDSVVTINLTIGQQTASITPTACRTYTAPSGAVYTSTGTYQDTIPTVGGCDSAITITLTVLDPEATITVNGQTLTADQAGAAFFYQWVECSTDLILLPGETNQSLNIPQFGSYAVILSVAGCLDTSACVEVLGNGVNPLVSATNTSIYPNPSNGWVTLELGDWSSATVSILNIVGQQVGAPTIVRESTHRFQIPGPAGIYLVRIEAEGRSEVHRVVVE